MLHYSLKLSDHFTLQLQTQMGVDKKKYVTLIFLATDEGESHTVDIHASVLDVENVKTYKATLKALW